ncbi:MAG: 3-dehydroquinate synthase [Synergistaceae bacterium]|jgi:3-dehydroquinate synthase|nr:3-dehydroquinate synthase [Synergistaceae bacterium]
MSPVKKLTVGLGERRYDILIAEGLLRDLGSLVRPLLSSDGPVAVVTDENVWGAYSDAASASLAASGVKFEPIVLPPGEGNKSMSGLATVYDGFAGLGVTRNGLVIAFGGGVIGDLCGFAAATWMRGARFVQVPTTLLAQVDSSVGGKTAINLPQGKNLAGAFHQPSLVVIDTGLLGTLPDREIKNGMSEVVKYGAIRSESLFEALGRRPGPELPDVIFECCRIKGEIVERDERDFGERMLLNFGHTLGHAIERQSGYEGYRHGEAVAFGSVLAASMGERMGVTEPGSAEALRRTLALHGLETDYPGDVSELLPALASDKKNLGGEVNMVLLRRIGDAFVRRTGLSEIASALEGLGRWT